MIRPCIRIGATLLAAAVVSATIVCGCLSAMESLNGLAEDSAAARRQPEAVRSVERGPLANLLIPKKTRLIIGYSRTAFA